MTAFGAAVVVDVSPADRPRWLEWRRQGIGASDVAGILGLSRWSSPWSVWADKAGLLPEEPENEVMEAGRWLERAIGPWFTHRTGIQVVREQLALEAAPWPVARCTLDGETVEADVALDGAPPRGGFEIKTAGFGRRWTEIPPHYQAQAQWQMLVGGYELVDFAVLMGRRLDVHVLKRDQADIDFMVERVGEFWSEHVVAGKPPPVDGSDATARALEAVYPRESPGTRVDVGHLADVIAEWHEAKAAESAAKDRKKALANEITVTLGDAEEGVIDGQRVVSWRAQTRAEHVVAESTFRVLRAHAPKKGKQPA